MICRNRIKKLSVTFIALITLGMAVTPSTANASYQPDYNVESTAPSLGKNQYVTSAAGKKQLQNSARAAAAMDAESGKFVYSKRGTTKYPIASTAKIMTLYLAAQKAEELDQWDHKVKISSSLSRMSKSPVLGSFKMNAGSKYTVRSLYQATLIASSNSAAIALGEYVAGSNSKFIQMMNEQAKAWGIANQASFVSASGLENSDLYYYGYSYGNRYDYNRVSARAITTIAYHLLDLYPDVVNDAQKRTARLNGQTLVNVNALLPGGYSYNAALNVDGLKTGYTPISGYCLVSTSMNDEGRRLIVTTLNDNRGSKDQAKMIAGIYKYSSLFNEY